MGFLNINEGIKDVTKFADEAFESEEERQATLTERLRLDTTSPFKLPHLIRPMSTIFSAVIWGISIIWVLIIATVMINKIGIEAASTAIMSSDSIIMYILAATTTNYATHIGFYFSSRKVEKNTAKKASAAIEVEKIKLVASIKAGERAEKRDEREERREERREKRKN
jgi:hypothetical protein